MNDNAQMMVLESVIFAITVMIALAFLVQLSPTSIQQSSESTTDLKILGDDALTSLSIEPLNLKDRRETRGDETNNPASKLAVAIIVNDYDAIIGTLNEDILPDYAFYQYNIYISNGTVTKFWCSYQGNTTAPADRIGDEQVAVSHYIISIDPKHLDNFGDGIYEGGAGESDIWQYFQDYEGATYDVILELWTMI